MADSTDDIDQTPATSEAEERKEAEVLAEGWIRVAIVSIFAVVLTAVGLLQSTGLLDLFPFGTDWTVEWLVLVVLAAVLVAIELWTWRSDQI